MARLDRFSDYLTETDSILYSRLDGEELQRDIGTISSSPVVDGLMKSVGGLFAVLNVHRQILGVNDAFLRQLGVKDGAEILGLRPGEAIRCIHAGESPEGCGTSKFCVSCGAAIAITTSLARNSSDERKCAAVVEKNGAPVDLCLRVRSTPHSIGGQRFIMLLLQDITEEEHRTELERSFLHDMGNIVTVLVGASEILSRRDGNRSELVEPIRRNVLLLEHELKVWNSLMREGTADYSPVMKEVLPAEILSKLKELFATHPQTFNKTLRFPENVPVEPIVTDIHLLLRILANMIVNALEGTDDGGEVRVWLEVVGGKVIFRVWNRQAIPEELALRVFQRNFSTKAPYGRGIGTYMLKRFGESVLGGSVGFTSTEKEGTTFSLSLPTPARQ